MRVAAWIAITPVSSQRAVISRAKLWVRTCSTKVIFTGYAYGGLSELLENEYFSCSMGPTIAGEIGVFGYRPSVLMDILAGKRAEVGTEVGAYMRTFSGGCSPSDMETALQLVYQLFTTNLTPDEEIVKIVMQMAEEAVCAQDRDPYTAFENRVNELNYGNSYFFRPITKSDLQKVDPLKACEYFIKCFKDPSTFTVVIVGNIDPTIALPLILQYLGGIPKPHEPIMHLNRDELKGLPFTFPKTIFREVVRSPMVEEQCLVQLCFPVELKNGTMVEEIHFVGFLSKLLETKIMQVLRFKHGQVDLTLDEMLRLQEEGPTDHDVSTILEIEQRAHENGLQENYYWLDMILDSYQSRAYSGDVGISFEIQDKGRSKVRSSLNPSTAQLALQRILPFPCTKQYTVVILMPKSSPFKLLKSVFQLMRISHGRDAKILAGIAGLVVLALSLWRHSRSANLHSRDMS
ncbi:hypothetical protein Lal_00026687 [Lupinus albus]|nr:hypothetical protein Lal_00026687 [Lupinus albus]